MNRSARCYVGTINDEPVAFLAVLHMPHAIVKNMKRVHRLVVLPDYQGIGIGLRFMNAIAEKYAKSKFRFTLTTSAPALIMSMKKDPHWKCTQFGVMKPPHGDPKMRKTSSTRRLVSSWEYKL